MSDKSVLAAFFVATIFVAGGSAWAATNSSPTPSAPPDSPAIKAFGQLSADGTRAFQDLRLTRLAIYDGDVGKAKTLVNEAADAFVKAEQDDSVFMKDESEMKTAAEINKVAGSRSTIAPDASNKKPSSSAQMAWLPVDGNITLDEDYSLSPAKSSAVTEANKSLAKGDRAGAIEKLKLAHVQTTATLEVVPIKQTIQDVKQASTMIDDGKYYEGSQMLRKVQMSARFDVTDILATPKTAAQ